MGMDDEKMSDVACLFRESTAQRSKVSTHILEDQNWKNSLIIRMIIGMRIKEGRSYSSYKKLYTSAILAKSEDRITRTALVY